MSVVDAIQAAAAVVGGSPPETAAAEYGVPLSDILGLLCDAVTRTAAAFADRPHR